MLNQNLEATQGFKMTEAATIRRLEFKGQWIDGLWDRSVSDSLVSTCPVDESVVWSGGAASSTQVDNALDAARNAVESWSQLPSDQRIEYVERYADQIKSKADELAELISAETGKPIWESKTEVNAVVGKSAVSIDAFRSRRDTTSFEMGELQAVTRFKPYGVMGVLGPFNFPAHLPNGHIVPAIIAGNTVVYKPSEQTPAVGQWMMEQWHDIGLPAGVINLVQGARDTGIALSSHQQIDGLLFTGSSRAGVMLHQQFGAHPEKILALEMGGNNPLIVHQADDLLAAAYLTVNSAFITAGQRCTCARRLIVVEDKTTQPFLDELVNMMGALDIGPFTQTPEPFAGTVISREQGKRLLKDQAELLQSGGRPIVEMRSKNGNDALLSPGLIDVTGVVDRSDEEMFGPILSLIRVATFDEAIAEANNTAYGLSAGLVSSSKELYQQFISRIRAGIVNWNRQTTGATGKLPFGGCGRSGNHHPSAYFAADYCSFPVASLESENLSMPEKPTQGIRL
ncbi:MAG: succinylglutamate-semialdehyde dehydrogenase [Planctomycetota bacterium]